MNLSCEDCNRKIINHLSSILMTDGVFSIYRNSTKVVKSEFNKNEILETSDISNEEIEKRNPRNWQYTWEPTQKKESLLFDDKNLTLCLRFKSPIDNKDDLYFATITPQILNLFNFADVNKNRQITQQDKEIIAITTHRSCQSVIDIIKSYKTELSEIIAYAKSKEKNIEQLKREKEEQKLKIKLATESKLKELSQHYKKQFIFTTDAEKQVSLFTGEDISDLMNALESAARIKNKIYVDEYRIEIDDFDIQIKKKEKTIEKNEETSIFHKHEKQKMYLLDIEKAVCNILESGDTQITATKVAEQINKSSASITMWFNKHSETSKRLCDKDPELCIKAREFFIPLKEAINGKRNKVS